MDEELFLFADDQLELEKASDNALVDLEKENLEKIDTDIPEIAAKTQNVLEAAPISDKKASEKPKGISDLVSIIQPRTVTFAPYDITAVQEDILTLTMDELQKYSSSQASLLRRDLFNQLSIELNCYDFPQFGRNVEKFVKELDKLRKLDFTFEWHFPFAGSELAKSMVGQDIETKGALFIARHRVKNTPIVSLSLNPWALPYLLYIGKGVGGTKYYKQIAFALKSKFSKRLYKMMMDWQTLGPEKSVSIESLRHDLQIPDSYDNNKIRTNILDVAVKEIRDSESSVKIEKYEMSTEKPVPGQSKQKFDTITFHFSGARRTVAQKATDNTNTLLMFLTDIAEDKQKQYCMKYAKDLVARNQAAKVLSKFSYYYGKVKVRDMHREEYINTMMYILREDFGIDLRNQAHRDNAARKARREESKNTKK